MFLVLVIKHEGKIMYLYITELNEYIPNFISTYGQYQIYFFKFLLIHFIQCNVLFQFPSGPQWCPALVPDQDLIQRPSVHDSCY